MPDLTKKYYIKILSTPGSRHSTDLIINDAGNNKKKFNILLSLVLQNEDSLSARAAWALEGIDLNYPSLTEPHIPALIKALPTFSHPGSMRNVLKILSRKNIPEGSLGKISDICFSLIQKRDNPVSIQVYSMIILENISKIYPEIMLELHEILESRIHESSPGFKSKAKKILRSN